MVERPPMSESEQEILKILWDHGPKTVREVVDLLTCQGSDWSRSTVITLLQRLEKKGYVKSDKSQFAFVFRATVTREEELHTRMQELAGELCDGEALPLVLAFTKQHKFSAEELSRFRKMIDAIEPSKTDTRRKKRGDS